MSHGNGSTNGGRVVVHAACPHDCPDACAMLVTVEDGVATAVRGDRSHPFTRGSLCAKVNDYEQRTYHPDRILYPMRRVGPKGQDTILEPTKYDLPKHGYDPFRLTAIEYSQMEAQKDQDLFGVLDGAVRQRAASRIEPRWGEYVKLLAAVVPPGGGVRHPDVRPGGALH